MEREQERSSSTSSVSESSPAHLWRVALQRVERGARAEASVAIQAALQASGNSAGFSALAARLFMLIEDFAAAFAAIAAAETASSGERPGHGMLRARVLTYGTLGDFEGARADLENLQSRQELLLPHWFEAAQLAAHVGALEVSLHWATLAGAHPALSSEQRLCLAEILHRIGQDETACRILCDLSATASQVAAGADKAAQLLLECRACDEAAQLFRQQLETNVSAVSAHLGLATICLWRRETAAARRHAELALGLNQDLLVAKRILAAVALLEGRPEDALSQLDQLAEQAPQDVELRTWRAEALLRAGQFEAALVEVRIARDASSGEGANAALPLIEALAKIRFGRRPDPSLMSGRIVATLCDEERSLRVRRLHRRIYFGRGLKLDRILAKVARRLPILGLGRESFDDPDAVAAIFESALDALGGNRSYATPTKLSGGRLTPVVVAPSLRRQVEAALRSVRVGGFDEANRRLEALMQEYPEWPLPWFYRAELLMWVGRWQEARQDLEAALAKRAYDPEIERGHWPRIGLAGLELMEGRPRAALRMIERARRGFNGPPAGPYHAWLGEILRAMGQLEEARGSLQMVCRPGGGRIGSMITLALIARDLGEREFPRQTLADLVRQAPLLMICVARNGAIGADAHVVFEDPGSLTDDEVRALLEAAQQAMWGNRSAACVTFVDPSGRLRAIPPGGVYRFVDHRAEVEQLRAQIAAIERAGGGAGPPDPLV